MLREYRIEEACDEMRQTRTPMSVQSAMVEVHQLTLADPLLWAFTCIRGQRLAQERSEFA